MATTLTLKRGDTWSAVFTYSDDAGPVSLAGCSARLQVRVKTTSELVLEATSDGGELVIDAAAGTVTLTATPAMTEDLPIGTHPFDLEMTWSDGRVQSTETLFLTVLKDVTYDESA